MELPIIRIEPDKFIIPYSFVKKNFMELLETIMEYSNLELILEDDEIETAIQNIPQDNLQVNPMPSGSGIQNSLSPNNLQVNPMPSGNFLFKLFIKRLNNFTFFIGSGIQNNYLPPGLYIPYSSSHESFVLIRRLRRLERLERRRTTRIARAESQATESRDEETKFTTTDSRRNSPPRDSRRNNFQTRWGEIGPGFQNYGNFNQSEPLNRRLPQDMELFQYNILKKYMDHYVRHGWTNIRLHQDTIRFMIKIFGDILIHHIS
ncbi:hypothetical protein TNCT_688821 [Trichonephila clavata]|uniref:Uncharacterized protein n=1 Tax=Trichonephila clavata TaxID=2740835 RepID=A0A8X6LN46_TRICU|nr:hypothetical protein TNCT_688821 [Trichonephila clavata]